MFKHRETGGRGRTAVRADGDVDDAVFVANAVDGRDDGGLRCIAASACHQRRVERGRLTVPEPNISRSVPSFSALTISPTVSQPGQFPFPR